MYQSEKKLKNSSVFITEDLTRYRQQIVQELILSILIVVLLTTCPFNCVSNSKHQKYFVFKMYPHWCLFTWMLYCASTIHLFVYIPTYVTWFSDVNIDTLTPLFSLLSEYSSTAVGWFINSPMPMHVFSDYILLFLFGFFCFTFVFHIPTASCYSWFTVCLSVVQILIFHVCSFFPTYTSCIQRLYKGQFKILQSYFDFILKCHWRRNTKYSTLFEYMCTYGR